MPRIGLTAGLLLQLPILHSVRLQAAMQLYAGQVCCSINDVMLFDSSVLLVPAHVGVKPALLLGMWSNMEAAHAPQTWQLHLIHYNITVCHMLSELSAANNNVAGSIQLQPCYMRACLLYVKSPPTCRSMTSQHSKRACLFVIVFILHMNTRHRQELPPPEPTQQPKQQQE